MTAQELIPSARPRDPTSASAAAALLSNRLLHLVLMPTEQCNFRCIYCYEDFELGQMSAEVVGAVKALIQRRAPRLDLLALEWFGGEPLLAWSVVEELQSFIREVVEQRPELRFHSAMTTNASLLDRRRFDRLLDLGLRGFQITLDGDPSAHDRTRRRRGGAGSFGAIWRNLCSMRETPRRFSATIRLHLTPENLSGQKKLLLLLARDFGGDTRFPILFKAIRHFGGARDGEMAVLEGLREEQVLGEFNERAEDLGLTAMRDPLAQPDALPGCYAAAAGSYVVRANGELAKCTVSLRHPNNRIGKLLPDGTLDLDGKKMLGWVRGSLNGDRESQECPAAGFAPPMPALVSIGSGSRSSVISD